MKLKHLLENSTESTYVALTKEEKSKMEKPSLNNKIDSPEYRFSSTSYKPNSYALLESSSYKKPFSDTSYKPNSYYESPNSSQGGKKPIRRK